MTLTPSGSNTGPVQRLALTLAALFSTQVPTSTATPMIANRLPATPGGTQLIVGSFPEIEQKRYVVFAKSCSKCHSLKWPISALLTGRTPVTKTPFEDAEIETYVIKMMRKRGSGIDKETANELVIFLRFARGLAREEKK